MAAVLFANPYLGRLPCPLPIPPSHYPCLSRFHPASQSIKSCSGNTKRLIYNFLQRLLKTMNAFLLCSGFPMADILWLPRSLTP